MQIKKVMTQNISYSGTSQTQNLSDSPVQLGIAAIGDSFEQKAPLQPGSLDLFSPPRIQPQSKADSIIAATAKALGQYLGNHMAEYGVQIDETALTAVATTIIKGGKEGILNALGITYGIAKLAMGPPHSDGVPEFLTSLVNNPQQAEEIAMPIITDPEFIPISAEQLQTMYALESMPFGNASTMLSSFFSQILTQRLQEMEPLSLEQTKFLRKFDEVIPLTFGSLASERTIRIQAAFSGTSTLDT